MKLWADIPPEDRVDEPFLLSRPLAKDERWLHRRLRELRAPACAAAVEYPGIPWCGKYKPCGLNPPAGMTLCLRHQGPVTATSAQFRLRTRLERERTDLQQRMGVLADKLAAVEKALTGLN